MGVEKIKMAIEQLSLRKRTVRAALFHGWKDDECDEQQMNRDVAKGKLNYVLGEVDDNIAARRLRFMP